MERGRDLLRDVSMMYDLLEKKERVWNVDGY